MIKIINNVRELEFGQLMEAYAQSNETTARNSYRHLPESVGVLNAEQDMYQYLSQVFFREKDAFYAVWEENGAYIAAVRAEKYSDGFLISALETMPSMRGRGYGKQLVSGVLDYIIRQYGKPVYSHVDKDNVPSLAVHKACGFEVWKNHASYLDGSVSDKAYTLVFRTELVKRY